MKKKIVTVLLIILFLIVGGIVLLKCVMFPTYEPLKVTGGYEVETAEFTWVDESRTETFTDTGEKRALTVKFWYPKEESNYPLVVFSHGAFGVIDSNYSTCMELASNGYVVASIGHPYHAMYVKDVNGKVTYADMDFIKSIYVGNGTYDSETEQIIYENGKEWMALRTADENFVIDTVLDKAGKGEDAPFSLINPEKIGLFGHSMGGASSVQLGRDRSDIDAVIDLEGTMFGEYVGFENGMEIYNENPYPVPLLDINSRTVHEQAKEAQAELADICPGWQYVNFYVGEHAVDYREIIFNDAGHLNFTDLPMISPLLAKMLGTGEVDARTCMENVNEVVLSFFNYYLKDEGTLDLQEEY
ncbi:MAG: alpha/beta hydrolase family protein [Suilimivivens sp.]